MSLFRRDFNSTFDYYKTKDEVCGTCKYNKRDWTNPNNPGFYCSNERSDYYGDNTEYKTTCGECQHRNNREKCPMRVFTSDNGFCSCGEKE